MPEAGHTTTVLLVAEDGTEVIASRVDARRPGLDLVDDLLRMQLAARRRGWRVRLRDAPPALRGLLELAGLAGVLALEPHREPEGGEELGIEEVVHPRDPLP